MISLRRHQLFSDFWFVTKIYLILSMFGGCLQNTSDSKSKTVLNDLPTLGPDL